MKTYNPNSMYLQHLRRAKQQAIRNLNAELMRTLRRMVDKEQERANQQAFKAGILEGIQMQMR